MKHIKGFKSVLSGNYYRYNSDTVWYQCEKTGENLEVIYDYVLQNELENVIAVDVTADEGIVTNYIPFIQELFVPLRPNCIKGMI